MKRIQIVNMRPNILAMAILVTAHGDFLNSDSHVLRFNHQNTDTGFSTADIPCCAAFSDFSRNIIARSPNLYGSRKNITAIMDDDNSLIFHIQGSVTTPGNVIVQYWSSGDGPFITPPVATNGNTFSLEIIRLRADTQYNYQVFLVGIFKYPGFSIPRDLYHRTAAPGTAKSPDTTHSRDPYL